MGRDARQDGSARTENMPLWAGGRFCVKQWAGRFAIFEGKMKNR